MKAVNKITIQELHAQLNARAGRTIPVRDLGILLHCWRKHNGYKSRGRQGWLSLSDASSFLHYAWS